VIEAPGQVEGRREGGVGVPVSARIDQSQVDEACKVRSKP
jgi:hypothetical protein